MHPTAMKKTFLILLSLLAIVPALAQNKLTVMSYNIRYGDADDGTNSWQFRYAATLAMLEDQKPDVFGVQEALDYQVKFISEYTPYKNVGVGRDDGKKKGEHMSIFYNKKTVSLIKWGTFWLSETPDVPSKGWDAACYRTATWALLKDKRSGKKFYFVNTHLDHVGWEARRKGLALIVDRIDAMNPQGLPMVLTGDFNMTADREEFQDLKERMQDAREVAPVTDNGPTWHNWGKASGAPIDFIFIKGFTAERFEAVRKPYLERNFVSDHYPVKAVLTF